MKPKIKMSKNRKISWTEVKEKYLEFHKIDKYSENMSIDIDFGYWLVNEAFIQKTDEFCEWKHNVYTDLFRTECGKNVYKHVGIKWNFCPYCGRKIKILGDCYICGDFSSFRSLDNSEINKLKT